jgi:hypothetical protein
MKEYMSYFTKLRTVSRLPISILVIVMKKRHAAISVFCSTAITALSFAFAFSQAAVKADSATIHGALQQISPAGTETVSVQFGSTLYKIPRDYLAGVTHARGVNSYAAFTIEVLLPELSPRTSENAPQFDAVGWHNKISALFEYGRHPRTPEAVLESYLKGIGMSKDDFQSVGSGYKLYQSPKFARREIYAKEMGNALLFFICGTTTGGTPFPSCTVNEAFEENVGVIYHFSRDYLNQAEEIDQKLHALLKSFEAN